MTTLTPAHKPAALVDTMPGTGRTDREGIRDLLRDTALLVTSIGAGGTVPDAAKFRDRCGQIIDAFANALERRGYPEDVRQEALVAQCGLLDEIALRHLSTDHRSSWELTPLQVQRFKMHDAGDYVIGRIEARLREPSPNVDLLECYAAILGMGFKGRYALPTATSSGTRDDHGKRTELIAALNTRLNALRPAAEQPFIADRAGRRISDWFYRLSPWAIAALACIAAAIVWGVWSVALDTQLTQITSAKVVRP